MSEELPSDFNELTDRSLLRRFRAGEQDAATALYLRYARRLEQLANAQTGPAMAARVDPEGIVQSVFRSFFRRTSSGQYEVDESEQLWKLLLVIALNKIRNATSHHRAAKRDVAQTRPLQEANLPFKASADEMALTVLRMTIDELLQQLPENQRPIILLRIEGYEVAEIAARTDRSKRTVERLLQRFRQDLENEIRRENGS